MATLEVDFNAQDVGRRIRLNTVCSRRSLTQTNVRPGDWVWLTDGELRAGGRVEEDREGLRALVAWETLEDLVPDDDELRAPKNVQAAFAEFGKQIHSTPPNYREILRVLPLLKDVLPAGEADSIRAQAAQAFGYPNLALLAIEEALRANPAESIWAHFRLQLLDDLDHNRALTEAEALLGQGRLPTPLLAICTQILAIEARRSSEERALALYSRIIESTNNFEPTPQREIGSPDLVEFVHYYRGLAFRECGDKARAVEELERAIEADPAFAPAYEARALESYPSDGAILDFQRALKLGTHSVWPGYYLAHNAIQNQDWIEVDRLATRALRFAPPPHVRSNLLEWLGITSFVLKGDRQTARKLLSEAIELVPDSPHLRHNLALVEQTPERSSPKLLEWEVVRDAEGRPAVMAA